MKSSMPMDEEGVESIPLKLIIVVLCLALIIPATWAGLTAYSKNQAENELIGEINRMVSAIKQTYDGDDGTSFSLEVDFQGGIFKKVEYVKIGDKIGEHGGPYRSIIRYKFYDENVRFVTIENPNIPTTSPFNTPLELEAGKQTIITEKYMIGEVGFVVVRTPKEDGIAFKMADVAIYEKDITILNRNDNIAGLIISATIRNIGNLDTGDPEAKWAGDGRIRVSIMDRIVLTGEVRTVRENLIVDSIPAYGSVTELVEWFPIQEGDNPQDPRLRKREITVSVDTLDNVDELTVRNNLVKKDYENKPPVVNFVTAEIDDDVPGIGTFVVGVDVMNTIGVNATDTDGWVRQVSFWWGNQAYPEDLYDPSHFDDTPEDGLTATLSMGEFDHTTNITVKAYDNAGFGGDPHNETIYMEIIPEWMNIIETRAKEEGTKSFEFDGDKNVFRLFIDVPGDLIEGFKKVFGGDLPFISGLNNAISNSYQLKLEIPIGADVNFTKEMDLGAGLFNKQLDGSAWIEATLHVGMDKSVEIDLGKIFDLIEDARYLVHYWEEFGEILEEVEWSKIKNPADVNELITALTDAYDIVKDRLEFRELRETIDSIRDTIEYYKSCYNELEDLWIAIMNFKDSPDSLLNLVSFEATAGLEISKDFDDWTLFSTWYPILPPFVSGEMIATASLSPSFEVITTLEGDLNGLDFSSATIRSEVDFGLGISFYVNIGVDFGFAAGGIKGGVTGSTIFELDAGGKYTTSTGFDPIFEGLFKVTLSASLEAFARFICWEKTWTFWEDTWVLGEWDFNLVDDTYKNEAEEVSKNVMEEELGDIHVPRGPMVATDKDGNKLYIKSEDLEQDINDIPNYEIMYSWDGVNYYRLTNNTKLEGEPAVVFNSTGSAFAFWTQCGENDYLIDTNLNAQDILQYAEIYYAIWDKNTASWKGPFQFTSNTFPDFEPKVGAGSDDGDVIVTWTGDYDGDLSTWLDKRRHFSIWNGSDWGGIEELLGHGSANYYFELANVSDGRIVCTWIHDEDENLYTTSDQQIMYSIFSNGHWSESKQLTDDNSSKELISLGGNGNKITLAWLSKKNGIWSISSKTWDRQTDLWSTTELFNESKSIIQYPHVAVTTDGIAILIWRSNYDLPNWSNPESGYIYFSTKDLNRNSSWTAPRVMAITNTTSDFYSAMALDSENRVIYVYRKNASTPREHPQDDLKTVIIELKPDLFISNVTVFSGSNVTAVEGDTIPVNATISNLGDIDAENVNISFYDGHPEAAGELIDSIVLKNLTRLGDSVVSFEWQVVNGTHDIYVVVDPDNEIIEHDEENNLGYCTVNCLPDMRIETHDITFSSNNPNEGDDLHVTANVHNIGHASAEIVLVSFYDGDPREGGALISAQTIESIGIGSIEKAVASWIVLAGTHEIYVEVEATGDMNLRNNLASKTISVLPDLSIDIGGLTLSSSELVENETVTISATLHNHGVASAENVIVKFCTSDIFIGYKVINLSVNGALTVSIEWKPPVGSHLIYVIVDPGDQICELSEANNIQYAMLTVLPCIDLLIDLRLNEDGGGKVVLFANVSNDGNGEMVNVSVEFYDGDPEMGGYLINSTTISDIKGNGYAEVSYEWRTSSGRKTVYAVVDGLNLIDEIDETNNVKYKIVDVNGQTSENEGTAGDGGQLPLIFIVLVLIAVPVIMILFCWRRRLIY